MHDAEMYHASVYTKRDHLKYGITKNGSEKEMKRAVCHKNNLGKRIIVTWILLAMIIILEAETDKLILVQAKESTQNLQLYAVMCTDDKVLFSSQMKNLNIKDLVYLYVLKEKKYGEECVVKGYWSELEPWLKKHGITIRAKVKPAIKENSKLVSLSQSGKIVISNNMKKNKLYVNVDLKVKGIKASIDDQSLNFNVTQQSAGKKPAYDEQYYKQAVEFKNVVNKMWNGEMTYDNLQKCQNYIYRFRNTPYIYQGMSKNGIIYNIKT